MLVLDNSQSVLKYSQFAVESMLGGIDLKPIFEEQFCFLGGSAHLLNVLGDSGFPVIYWMDGTRNDASKWIGIRHGT